MRALISFAFIAVPLTFSAGCSSNVKESAPGPSTRAVSAQAVVAPGGCVVTGCSGQLCSDEPIATTCEWRPEYACYRRAVCERGADGDCDWRDTPELQACLDGSAALANPAAKTNAIPPPPPPPPNDELQWYSTCGRPVCAIDGPPTGSPPCTTEDVGDPCTEEGLRCDPGSGCGVDLVCASSDPKVGGCPISTAKAKRGISYLTDADAKRIADDVNNIKLATYEYKDARLAGKRHLGFIIEDMPRSPAVRAADQVDLYGYTSMVVAALKVQAKETEALKRELAELKVELGAARGASSRVCGGR